MPLPELDTRSSLELQKRQLRLLTLRPPAPTGCGRRTELTSFPLTRQQGNSQQTLAQLWPVTEICTLSLMESLPVTTPGFSLRVLASLSSPSGEPTTWFHLACPAPPSRHSYNATSSRKSSWIPAGGRILSFPHPSYIFGGNYPNCRG